MCNNVDVRHCAHQSYHPVVYPVIGGTRHNTAVSQLEGKKTAFLGGGFIIPHFLETTLGSVDAHTEPVSSRYCSSFQSTTLWDDGEPRIDTIGSRYVPTTSPFDFFFFSAGNPVTAVFFCGGAGWGERAVKVKGQQL